MKLVGAISSELDVVANTKRYKINKTKKRIPTTKLIEKYLPK
jgi:hypothetical protein